MNHPPSKAPNPGASSSAAPDLLTIDVEHWFEGLRYRGLDGWQQHPLRDDRIMERLLDSLAGTKQRATLFFTGRYAEDFPHIVRRAAREGHEIASHSYAHTVFPRLKNLVEFREDLTRSVAILENLAGCKIRGYRAPKWSIPEGSRQVTLSILAELGFAYDSSKFPRWFDSARASYPHRVDLLNGSSLWEVPATTYPLCGLRLPVAGGLYFRLLPAWVTEVAFASCRQQGQPGMIYLHPYDIDADCPQPPVGGRLFRWLRYYGVSTAFDLLGHMLTRYQFTTVADYLCQRDQAGLVAAPPAAPLVPRT